MIREPLLTALRRHTGPIWLSVTNAHGSFWMQGVKADVIHQMAALPAGSETGFRLDAEGYFSTDYDAS